MNIFKKEGIIMSELYKEIEWICPKCSYKNQDTYLDIETHPVKCKNCQKDFDIFLQAKLDIKGIQVSDGNVTISEKMKIANELMKRDPKLGKEFKKDFLLKSIKGGKNHENNR